MAEGFVYLLSSPNSDFIKIGGTAKALRERLRGINNGSTYSMHGPWEVSDFLHVTDWRLVEAQLHTHFRKQHVKHIANTRELFAVPAHEARKQFARVAPSLRIGHEQTTKLFKRRDLSLYLFRLFQLAGLFGNLDIQGAWTLSLFTQTVGGRFFTINLGRHEVAFSPLSSADEGWHFLVVDQLIKDFPKVAKWLRERGGGIENANYANARRAVRLSFRSTFADAEKLFAVDGIRRALIAYWADGLADLRERDARSRYARYHNYDAVYGLVEHARARQRVIAS